MNGALNKSLVDPWLATSVSFLLVLFLAIAPVACMPRHLPDVGDMAGISWWRRWTVSPARSRCSPACG